MESGRRAWFHLRRWIGGGQGARVREKGRGGEEVHHRRVLGLQPPPTSYRWGTTNERETGRCDGLAISTGSDGQEGGMGPSQVVLCLGDYGFAKKTNRLRKKIKKELKEKK
jgi:hypothetical protein